MVSVRYSLQILDGPWCDGEGFGYGINDGGVAVGSVAVPVQPTYGICGTGPAFWPPSQPNMPMVPLFPDAPNGGLLLKVDAFGNAVGVVDNGSAQLAAIVNANGQLIADLSSIGYPSDINNLAMVTGTDYGGPPPPGSQFGSRAFIYTLFPLPGNQVWLSPLPNSTGISASAINDLGDVVGSCNNNAGFFYSASTKEMIGIDSCALSDINVNRLAVGQAVTGNRYTDQPIMVNLAQANPVVQSIPAPQGFAGAVATAVNSSNTIVGICNTQTLYDQCAFVAYNGQAYDLNTLVTNSFSYFLIDAMDINEAGQIVGTAVSGPVDQPTAVYPYVATPYELPPTPHGPVRSWPYPIWLWPWGWLPSPVPPSQFGPSPLLRLASSIRRMPIPRSPITPKRSAHLRDLLAAHRARIFRHHAAKHRA